MSSSSFYVTLPSHSSKNEFPNNTSNHFKIRLPNPIRLEGSGWKVGMVAISLPDTKVSLPPLVTTDDEMPNPILAKCEWVRVNGDNTTTKGVSNFDNNDLKKVLYNVDGVGFMKSMIAFFEQRRIYNDEGPKQGASYLTKDGKRTYIKFVWEGDELVLDNREVVTTSEVGSRPGFGFNQELAKRMGWIVWNKTLDAYQLGPNIQHEFTQDTIPTLTAFSGDVFDKNGKAVFWTVYNGLMELSIFCNWRFLNFNQAFQNVVGSRSRSLLIYSDVGGSSVVGNQVTDLLRQVNFHLRGDGSQYFEPTHIQYIPVRKDIIDIIETQVAETTGELTRFGEGNTIVTLQFKKE